LPILIVNHFSAADRIANFFRNQAAITGTKGAALDDLIQGASAYKTFSKSSSSAFTNRDLHPFLQSQGITDLYILGVFAEGCVRATVADARKLGYPVTVIADAIATNAPWKKRLALWSMTRSGASVIPTVLP
jgi:nicotinamidase-related amidase